MLAGVNHFVALLQRECHRLFNQNVLTVSGCEFRMFGMELMWTSQIEDLYRLVSCKRFDVFIDRRIEVPYELRPCRCARIAGSDQADTLILQERGQHQCEGTTESGNTNAQGFVISHRSSTSSSDLARETQIMI